MSRPQSWRGNWPHSCPRLRRPCPVGGSSPEVEAFYHKSPIKFQHFVLPCTQTASFVRLDDNKWNVSQNINLTNQGNYWLHNLTFWIAHFEIGLHKWLDCTLRICPELKTLAIMVLNKCFAILQKSLPIPPHTIYPPSLRQAPPAAAGCLRGHSYSWSSIAANEFG